MVQGRGVLQVYNQDLVIAQKVEHLFLIINNMEKKT